MSLSVIETLLQAITELTRPEDVIAALDSLLAEVSAEVRLHDEWACKRQAEREAEARAPQIMDETVPF